MTAQFSAQKWHRQGPEMKKRKPLFAYLAVIFSGMIIVLMFLMGYGSWKLYTQAKGQIRELAENNLKIYEQDIFVRLNKLRGDLQEVMNRTLDTNLSDKGELDRFFAQQELYELLSEKLSNNQDSGAYFIRNEEAEIYLRNYGSGLEKQEKVVFEDLVRHKAFETSGILEEEWNVMDLAGRPFLYQVYSMEGSEAGVFISVEKLAHLMTVKQDEDVEETFIISLSDQPILEKGKEIGREIRFLDGAPNIADKRYIMASIPVRNCGLRLTYFRKDDGFRTFWGSTQILLFLTGLLCLFMTVLLYLVIQKKVLYPIRELEKGAVRIENGDYSYRVPEEEGSLEFDRLSENFNSMTAEIVNLRIREYERKLEMKDREVRLLLAQVRPHFYLNAITTIQGMTWQNRNEDIRRYIDSLSVHIRYMLQKNVQNVTLHQELEHVGNFLKMQEIRQPDSIFWLIECPEELNGIKIPHLLIHTIVENIFKHAIGNEDVLNILIQCTKQENPLNCVCIAVEDNGGGFSQEVLKKYNSGNEIEEDGQIGLSNIFKTLEVLYERKDLLHISNSFPHGARVEISIPVT